MQWIAVRSVAVAAAAAGITAAAGGCGKSGPTTLVIDSFNAGLAVGFVPGADSRTPLVADAVGGLDADVVCLQEVWLPDQISAIASAAEAAYPYQYTPEPQQSADASCAAGELDNLLGCIESSCDFTCADDVPDCLFASCPIQFIGLSPECMRCAMANVGEDPATVADTCTAAPVEYAYGGSFGTMLLSKHPIASTEEHVFTSTSNRRSVLHAELELDGRDATLPVLCTHLTAVFDDIPYPRTEGSWEDEQLVEIDEINALATGLGDGPRILVGDLNTGPGLDGIQAEAPGGYQALVDAGWKAPYVNIDGRCTFCATNPLIGGSPDDNDDRLIDHVMLQGAVEATAATRILDETVTADSCAVDLSTAALSDHYGISVTVDVAAE